MVPHESLPSQGPGRAGNGNFVLTNLRVYSSNDLEVSERSDIELTAAEADFTQAKFSPSDVLNENGKTGWAIGGKIGMPHHLTAFTRQPVAANSAKYLQVVLDQQYGGLHTIGSFRISTMSGFDPLKNVTGDGSSRHSQTK